MWYAAAIPSGKSFLTALFACKLRVGSASGRVRITEGAQQELAWWRALMIVSFKEPRLIAASIDSVRNSLVPRWFLRTDASSLVGGGGWVSDDYDGDPLPGFEGEAIRWTKDELRIFAEMKVSINVMEYFVVVYYVILWSEKFRNSVILCECDNTAAVSWIKKSRVHRSAYADSLAKIFSLHCLKYNITLTCSHLAGTKNVLADFRSRDLNLYSQDADEGMDLGKELKHCSRAEVCRRLLHHSITRPEATHGAEILRILTALRLGRGSDHAKPLDKMSIVKEKKVSWEGNK